MIGQKDDNGNEYLCVCISRSLNKHEKNYPSYKGELLALAWAIRSFRTHVHGTKFKLVTDHQPLTWLMKATDLTGQYARWQMLVQEYDFEIVHRPGHKHQNADVLSRFPRASTEDITGARMDVEGLVAAITKVGVENGWLCPDHGLDCPGRRFLAPDGKYESYVECPEHGAGCTSKACAKLLEAHYTWDGSSSRWCEPQESRDTCMECCSEACWNHPLRDEICNHVCHKCSGMPIPRPPTPHKGYKPKNPAVAAAREVKGPRSRPPDFKGRVIPQLNNQWVWERQPGSGNYPTDAECIADCYKHGMEVFQPRMGTYAASRKVWKECCESCTCGLPVEGCPACEAMMRRPTHGKVIPKPKEVAFLMPTDLANTVCPKCGRDWDEHHVYDPDYKGPPMNRTDRFRNDWNWDFGVMAEGTTRDECIDTCYHHGMKALAGKRGVLDASSHVYKVCENRCSGEQRPRNLLKRKPRGKSTIDSFAPPFTDFIDPENSGFLGRDCYMNNGLRKPYETNTDDDELGEHSRLSDHQESAKLVASICTAAKESIVTAIPEAVVKAAAELSAPVDPAYPNLDQGVVSASFFPNAARDGITLVELCAGIGAGLEAALLSGIKVNKYIYVDIDPLARDIAKFRAANLSAKFPDLFPPTSWERAFDLPQDINALRDYHIDHYLADKPQQILLIAGWPCQEYSPAGKGRPGARAAILDKVVSILVRLQALQPEHPVAYLLENVALQDNFRHANIRDVVAPQVEAKIGKAVTFDAANVGSYATRIRNYWTNLGGRRPMQKVYDNLRCPHKGNLYDILGEGRHPMPVEGPSRGGHNVPGDVRAVLPTLMSFRNSRAFRPTKAGSIYASEQGAFTEPVAVERELAMGYEAGSTAAPEVDDLDRCKALGQAIDLNALFSIFQVAKQLHHNGLSHYGHAKREPKSRVVRTLAAFRFAGSSHEGPGDSYGDSQLSSTELVAFVGRIPTDIWEDDEVVTYLQDGTLPSDQSEARRVVRRSKLYRWFNNRLYRVVTTQGEPNTYRIIPNPAERDRIILDAHTDLGHLGEKRCISAMSATYWWYGMTLDIKRVISGCKTCKRVKASGGHLQREMQTESPETYGLFHRWGLDHIVDLPTSASGFKHALVCIDYYSKWIEVIPVKDLSSETTVQAFLLNVIARFGTPAEIITDNGSAFKNEFRDFCRRRLIHQRFITEDVPRSNGLAERAVQTVKHALRKFAAQKHNALEWDTYGLAAILAGYRLSCASTELCAITVTYLGGMHWHGTTAAESAADMLLTQC